jgi:ABC-type glutathione transport system ATPase component
VTPLLRVEALTKLYPRRRPSLLRPAPDPVRALDGVAFTLARGEALGLVGESGSGKSTLARCLVGLEHATSGSIRLGDDELVGRTPAAWRPLRRRIQLVFQDPSAALDPRQTALASVREPLDIHALETPRRRRTRALELLDRVGIPAGQAENLPHEFSGGQRQRIGIARALALEPECLVCDEPVSALDVSVRSQILNLLHELLVDLGLALLFITHDLAVVRALCAHVAVLHRGRLVELAPREELFARPAHEYTRTLLAGAPRWKRDAQPG